MKKPERTAGLLALAIIATIFVSCGSSAPSTDGMPTVDSFDLALFEGKWFEISRIPIPVASDWVGTSDTYVPNGDGTWTVLYEGFKGSFDGKPGLMKQQLKTPDPARPGEMLASPFPLVWLPYRLVWWNAADRMMLVTSGTTKYLWVMARDPVPEPAAYAAAVAKASDLGFDVSQLQTVPQLPADRQP